jgi:two-component system sensor histidine kinase CpxA
VVLDINMVRQATVTEQFAGSGKLLRSIFWKIFIWFWLACLLIMSAVFLVSRTTDPNSFLDEWRSFPASLFFDEPIRCANIYEANGSRALGKYLSELADRMSRPETRDIRFDGLYFLDTNGTDLSSGNRATPELRGVAQETVNYPDIHIFKALDHLLIAKSVATPSGNHYVFVVAAPREALFWSINWSTGLRIVAVVVVATLVCYGLTRYVVTPIVQLRTATQAIAAGQLKTRITQRWLINRRDEFSALAADFNEMADRIENLLEAQRRLIADISHELRSPLTRMNVALGLAYRKINPEAKPQLERIEREAARLNDLIRQMLFLSQLENQTNAQPSREIDLGRLLTEVVADADFEARHNDRAARLDRCDRARVRGIEELLRRALENVIRNAIRYTAINTDVIVQLVSNLGGISVIQVTDRGPGMPDGEIERIFQPFYRVSESRDSASGGVGLGLAIARRAIEVHGGEIEARNLAEGGFQVEIRLPA